MVSVARIFDFRLAQLFGAKFNCSNSLYGRVLECRYHNLHDGVLRFETQLYLALAVLGYDLQLNLGALPPTVARFTAAGFPPCL